jgi:ATP-dependent RNA helicase DDX49/DBP8
MSSPPSFQSLGIGRPLRDVLSKMNITTPTPVQAACIPPTLAGKSIIGAAPTGSGKTAAYALPILQLLSRDPFGVFALVLTPTRELALQIREQFLVFGSVMGLRCTALIGGNDHTAQLVELTDNPHVVIATPGRLLERLRTNAADFRLARLRVLVLDEADRLISQKFHAELNGILQQLPPSAQRQTLYFSATMTPSLDRMMQISAAPPFRFDQSPLQPLAVVREVAQRFVCVPERAKICYLVYALRTMIEQNPKNQAIVFSATCRRAQQLAMALERLDIKTAPLHSMLPQKVRTRSLGELRSGSLRVLSATDVAARGLDIAGVNLVVHLDLPDEAASYVHRTGRTARAGRFGEALAIVTPREMHAMRALEQQIGSTLRELTVDNEDVRYHVREAVTAWRLANAALTDTGFDDRLQVRMDRKRRAQGDAGDDQDDEGAKVRRQGEEAAPSE